MNTYLVIDTETATLPFVKDVANTEEKRKNVAIAKPLVYDIGWTLIADSGEVLNTENFLIQETFFVPSVFNTAYYKEKRPLYMDMLNKGEIEIACWNVAYKKFLEDVAKCDFICAYNACFDLKKAIPFTNKYISALYSNDYSKFEKNQKMSCKMIADGAKPTKNPDYLDPWFEGKPIYDIWGGVCEHLLGDEYKHFCMKNAYITASGEYFKTSAENTYQYILNKYNFIESHTALDDARIEAQLLLKILEKTEIEADLGAFPFRKLGTTFDFIKKYPEYTETVRIALHDYLVKKDGVSRAFDKQKYYEIRLKKHDIMLCLEIDY